MHRYKSQKGFALLGLMVALAAIPTAVLVTTQASNVMQTTNRFFQNNRLKQSLYVVRDFVTVNAQDVDGDGSFELPKEGAVNALPLGLPINPNDEYGTAYKYCTWDPAVANGVNATYSQNHVAPPKADLIGKIISAGADRVIQTGCGDADTIGDDIAVEIYDSNVKNTNAGISGWSHIDDKVTLLNPANNIGLGVSTPTHKLELAAGTTPAAGIAMGEVEMYRSAPNVMSLSTGNSLNLDSGAISMGGSIVIDSARNVTGNNLTLAGGLVTMNNATSNMMVMGAAGVAPPSTAATSAGSKLVLYPMGGGGLADYALGIDANTLWQSIPGNNAFTTFKWYGGATNVMTLDGTGHLGVGTAPNAAYSINSAGAVNASAYYLNGVLTTQVAAGSSPGQTLYWDGANWAATGGVSYDAGTGAVNIATGPLKMGGTTVIDSLRYLTGVSWVAQNFNPAINNTYDLGNGPAGQWRNIYSQNLYQNGNKVADVFGSAIGYVPKFTGLNTLGNSLIYDNGTGVGIGLTTPGALSGTDTGARLELLTSGAAGAAGNGALRWYGNNGTYVGWIAKADAVIDGNYFGGARLSFTTPDAAGAPVQTLSMKAGAVAIGTITPWTATKLDVHQTGNPGPGGWGVAGYFHTSGGTGSNIAVNPEAIVATTGTNYGLYATAANGASGNVAIYIPAAYPPAGANNYAFKSESLAKSTFAGDVGIGTFAPDHRLDVRGATRTAAFTANDDSTWATQQVYNLTGITNSARGIKFGDFDATTKGAGIVGISKNTTGGRVELAFITSTGNTSYERMRIDEAGNVGIGVSSPTRKLQVAGSAVFGTVGNADTTIFDQGTYGAIGTNGNYPFAFFSNGTEKARITTAGNFLLGLSTPVTGTTLEVNGTASFTSTVDAGTIRSASYLVAKDAAGNTANSGVNFNALTLGKDGTNGMGWIQSYGAIGGATQATQINPLGGNILMGTTSDNGSRLQVSAPALASFTGGGRGAASLTVPYDGTSYTGIDFNYSGNSGVQARIAARLMGAGSYLHFGTSNNYGSGVTNSALTIDPLGNVTAANNLSAATYSGSVAGSPYGAITLSGLTNGYSGIYQPNAVGTVAGMFSAAGNGGDYDASTGWHYYWNVANSCLGIGGSATTAGYKAQVNGSLNTVGNVNVTGHVQTAEGILTGGAISRTAAGAGYLNGGYPGVETTATSGAIYSIGGAYVPGINTLGNMYGIGYGYSNTLITATGAPANLWGMYVASGGISRIFLSSDNGNIYANGTIYSAGKAVLTASATGQIDAPSNAGTGGFISSGNYGGTGNAAWFPSGIYSAGTNWLYGSVVFNGAVSGATTLSVNTSITTADMYISGWFRNNATLTGLYNTVNANHLYSDSASYWSLTTGGTGGGGLLIRDTHQGSVKGYLYHAGGSFGLLHSAGGWAVRVTPTTTDLYGTTITANGNFVSTGTVTGTTVHNAVYN